MNQNIIPTQYLRRLIGGAFSAKTALLTLMISLSWLLLHGAPFRNLHLFFNQPDGTRIEIVGSGDEFYAEFETLDGYTVVFDPAAKAYCYAQLAGDGRLVSTGRQVQEAAGASLGLATHARVSPEVRAQQARERWQRWEAGMEVQPRWKDLKAKLQAATLAGAGAPTPSGIEPGPPGSTTTGNRMGLTLLIDFDNDPATIPQAEIVNFCNGDAYTGYGNNGSVKKYFQDVSNGLLTYSNVVTIYIRIPNSLHPKSYYNDTTKDCGAQANLLIRDAITIMKALPNYTTEILPTFNNLTVDANNRVVAFNVFYAGGNGDVWSFGLWPHSWALYNVGAQYLSPGGKQVFRYQVSNIGAALEIGTFVHENGHMLCGFPDLYDYTGLSSGVGSFCLMAGGSWGGSPAGSNPEQVCAYLKRAAGWATTIALTSSSAQLATVTATAGTNFNHFYRFQKPGVSTEYFLAECRYRSGHDAALPGSGVVLWHIDELGDNSSVNLNPNTIHSNYEATVVQADNLWHLEKNQNGGDSKDFWYSGNTATGYKNKFGDGTTPNAHWWNGTTSGVDFNSFSAAGATMTFLVGGQPVITVQPQDVAVPLGGNATFRVTATGPGPLGYQWRFEGAAIDGATASSYTCLNVQLTNVGGYSVQVTNGVGTVTSRVAALSIVWPPVITSHPQPQTVIAGQPASFTVSASGTAPFNYQWQRNGGPVPGATASTYALAAAQAADAGDYAVAVSNAAGSALSSNATLTVYSPPVITVQPANVVTGLTLSAVFAVTASGTLPMSFQWKFGGADLSGATESALILTNLQVAHAGTYSVVVTNSYGSAASSNATLSVLDPFIVTQPQDLAGKLGGDATFTVSAVGTLPLAYQWQFDGTNLSEAAASLVLTNLQASDMGYYRCAISNVSGFVCSAAAALVVTDAPPKITVQPTSVNVAAGGTARFSGSALGTGPLSYQWQRQGTNLADAARVSGATSTALALAAVQAAEMAAYRLVVSNAAGAVSSAEALLRVWPLVGWGHNGYVQADIPAGLTNVINLAAGHYHSLALREDGTVVAWGAGTNNTGTTPQYGQAIVPADLANVIGLASGGYHSLALKADGTIAAWGAGTTNSGVPPNYGQSIAPTGLSNVTSVAGGFYHSLARTGDGTVFAWGANAFNQTNVPVDLTNATAIAAGNSHSLALRTDGTVAAWGAGMVDTGVSPHYGQSLVPAGLSDVVAIAAGAYHSLALKADGTVAAWGAGATNTGVSPHYGQAVVPEGLSNVVALAAGLYHSMALRSDGTLVVWGADSYGQASTPTGLSNVVVVAAGSYHDLVLQNDGRPWLLAQPMSQAVLVGGTVTLSVRVISPFPLTWQWQRNGTNLDGATNASLTLSGLQPLDAGAYRVIVSNSAGATTSATAAVTLADAPPLIVSQPESQRAPAGSSIALTAGVVGTEPLTFHWLREGTNLADGGKLSGATTARLQIDNFQAADMANYFLAISNAYGVAATTNVWLTVWPLVGWGQNNYGQSDVPAGLESAARVAAGYYHSLALRSNGTVVAWGAGTNKTGTSPQYGQAMVPADLTNATAIAARGYHSLALTASGGVVAWGAGTTNTGVSPNNGQSIVPADLTNATAIAAGFYHSLALRDNGTLAAWGANTYGQANVPDAATNVIAIAAGNFHNLALKTDGTVMAWGAGLVDSGINPHYGQSMVPAGLSNVAAVACGAYHSLALLGDGTLVAWGAGTSNLGVSPHYGQAQPPSGLSNVISVTGGFYHTLAARADGTVLAWGYSNYGQGAVPTGVRDGASLAAGGFHNLVLEHEATATETPPVLVLQPADRTVSAGTDVSFAVQATGSAPLAYQWFFNQTQPLAGATSNQLTVTRARLADAGGYSVVVTNSVGAVTSALATLTVTLPPVTLAQPGLTGEGRLQFAISGMDGLAYSIEASTNLSDWIPLTTNRLPFVFTDAETTSFPARFYRAHYED